MVVERPTVSCLLSLTSIKALRRY